MPEPVLYKNALSPADETHSVVTTLLLVTYEYPYGLAETFLETELPIVASHFDRVIIAPARACWSPDKVSSQHRPLPENTCIARFSQKSCLDLWHILKTFFKILLRSDFFFDHNKKFPNYFVSLFWTFRSTFKSALLFQKIKQDILKSENVNFAYSYWMGESAISLASLCRTGHLKAFVSRCHGGDLYDSIQPAGRRLFDNLLFSSSSAIFPISEKGRQALLDAGCPEEKVNVHRLGVVLPELTSPLVEKSYFQIVSCSNVIPVKRVELLARSLARLEIAFEWVHFGDGEMLSDVQCIAKDFPATAKAKFMGRRPNAEVLDYYRNKSVDLFVNTSSSEGVPVSIMEALAYGIPCVATDVGGTAEIIDRLCGKLLSPNPSEQEVAEAIMSVVNLRMDDRQKLRSGARRKAETMCDAVANYQRFGAWLRSTCDA